jgi:hypothetical protein
VLLLPIPDSFWSCANKELGALSAATGPGTPDALLRTTRGRWCCRPSPRSSMSSAEPRQGGVVWSPGEKARQGHGGKVGREEQSTHAILNLRVENGIKTRTGVSLKVQYMQPESLNISSHKAAWPE